MKTPDKIQDLVAEVVHRYSGAHIELDPLPTGVCFLWVSLGRRHLVLEYHPTEGTGVSENFDDTPPFIGHDVAHDSLDEAINHFKSLLADAAQTEADYQPQAFVLRENFPN